jgi:hypothetical protein
VSSPADLKARIEWLERELPPNAPRFKVHDSLPFAVLRYDPDDEWAMRREIRHLATRLQNQGLTVKVVSLAELLWRAIDATEGLDAIVELERSSGFAAAQNQVVTFLADADFAPLADRVVQAVTGLDPERSVCFLVRAASLAPGLYPLSTLLHELQGRTRVPIVLCYPGQLEGANRLRFMGLPDRDSRGSYRVKIYG